MRKYLGLVFILIGISFLGAASVGARDPDERVMNAARDFALQGLDNNSVLLSSYKGKQPVILFFWTTWCPFCQQELKKLQDLQADFTNNGVELLAINVGEAQRKVEKAVKNYGLTFKVLLDKDASVADSFEVLGVPTYILINKTGRIKAIDHTFPQSEYKELIFSK